jgi:hypothetical protein
MTPAIAGPRAPCSVASAADALASALSGASSPADGAAAAGQFALAANVGTSVPPAVLDGLARLATQRIDIAAAEGAAVALVMVSRFSPRPWCALAASGAVQHVPFVSKCIAGAVLPSPDELAGRSLLARDLRRLSESPVASKVALASPGSSTPLACAVAHELAELRRVRGRSGASADGAVSSAVWALSEKLRVAFDALAASSWDHVCDDEFAGVVDVLRSSSASDRGRAALRSTPFLRRLRSGFARGTPAAGRVYGMLSWGGRRAWPAAADVVAGWPALFGDAPGFKTGYLEWRVEQGGPELCKLRDVTEAEQIVAYVAGGLVSESDIAGLVAARGWIGEVQRGGGGVSSAAGKLLAAAYIAAPDVLRTRLIDVPQLRPYVLAAPLSLRGTVDRIVEESVTAMLAEVPDVGASLGAVVCSAAGDVLPARSSEEAARSAVDRAALCLRRLSLSHPYLAVRRADLVCAAVQCVLSSARPSDTASVNAATGLLRALVGFHHDARLDENTGATAWASASDGVRAALGEGRALNGVRNHFAALAAAGCELLGCLLAPTSATSAACAELWKADLDLRKALRNAGQAVGTDVALRVAVDKLLAS